MALPLTITTKLPPPPTLPHQTLPPLLCLAISGGQRRGGADGPLTNSPSFSSSLFLPHTRRPNPPPCLFMFVASFTFGGISGGLNTAAPSKPHPLFLLLKTVHLKSDLLLSVLFLLRRVECPSGEIFAGFRRPPSCKALVSFSPLSLATISSSFINITNIFFTPFFFPTAQWLFQHFLAKQRLNPVRKPVYSGPKQHW